MFDKRLMKMCPESRKYIIGNILFQWAELIINAVMIGAIAMLVEGLYEKSETAQTIGIKTGILLVMLILRWFTTKGATRMSYLASKTVKRVMREQIYKKLLRLGSTYREHVTTAELVQESVEGVEQLESYFGQYVPQFFYAFLAPITLFFLFGAAGSFKVATVLLVCVPLIPSAIMMVQKIAKRILSKYWDQYTKLGSTFLENLRGMTTLKTYKADALKNEQMNEESENFRVVTMKVLTMQLNSIIIMDFFAYGGAALGIALACTAFADGSIGLASVIGMILLSADFFLPMRRLGSYFHVAMNGMAASDKIFRFLSETEPAKKKEIFPRAYDIRMQNVSFSYTEDREVLHDVSMSMKEGGFTGIVGESGSGKSTVASILTGRNTVSVGTVTVGGKNLSEINEESLLKNVTYVGIGSVFFKGTVRENLLLADPNATDEKLWKVLEECSVAGFFRNENGLDTLLKENAGNLSGGQKQRLALARALLCDSSIYIFDEATSNIDMESEEAILNEIGKLAETKTVIMITHRLANVVGADRIFCLEDGYVRGEGTHESLMSDCPAYKRLWDTQKELEDFGKGVA
ncbi:MAG: ABC transporter ATP-binding protein/permease [Lachnospiraceae bacterium]|nr:ABC transporter ATP-binding protein/permease [Lachnospiraceae bacterium]